MKFIFFTGTGSWRYSQKPASRITISEIIILWIKLARIKNQLFWQKLTSFTFRNRLLIKQIKNSLRKKKTFQASIETDKNKRQLLSKTSFSTSSFKFTSWGQIFLNYHHCSVKILSPCRKINTLHSGNKFLCIKLKIHFIRTNPSKLSSLSA